MKISELSRRAGIPIATLKFYIREGLLPAGQRTAKNQASYAEQHLARLDLIRALHDDAGLNLATIARVLSAASGANDAGSAIGAALAALDQSRSSADPIDPESEQGRRAWALLANAARTAGWTVSREQAPAADAVRAIVAIDRAMPGTLDAKLLARYVAIARQIAELEIPEGWAPGDDPHGWLKYALLGTYLFEPLILSLRRVGHMQRSWALIGDRERRTRSDHDGASQNRSPRARRSKTVKPRGRREK
jgi:DNA-binding transcriptional MerR regulator